MASSQIWSRKRIPCLLSSFHTHNLKRHFPSCTYRETSNQLSILFSALKNSSPLPAFLYENQFPNPKCPFFTENASCKSEEQGQKPVQVTLLSQFVWHSTFRSLCSTMIQKKRKTIPPTQLAHHYTKYYFPMLLKLHSTAGLLNFPQKLLPQAVKAHSVRKKWRSIRWVFFRSRCPFHCTVQLCSGSAQVRRRHWLFAKPKLTFHLKETLSMFHFFSSVSYSFYFPYSVLRCKQNAAQSRKGSTLKWVCK